MQLWAGSFVIDPNRKYEERMEVSRDCSVLAGCLSNLYSEADIVLRYGQPIMHSESGTQSIGIQQILVDIHEDEDGKIGCKKAVNLDVTKEAKDHHGYFKGCHDFF